MDCRDQQQKYSIDDLYRYLLQFIAIAVQVAFFFLPLPCIKTFCSTSVFLCLSVTHIAFDFLHFGLLSHLKAGQRFVIFLLYFGR